MIKYKGHTYREVVAAGLPVDGRLYCQAYLVPPEEVEDHPDLQWADPDGSYDWYQEDYPLAKTYWNGFRTSRDYIVWLEDENEAWYRDDEDEPHHYIGPDSLADNLSMVEEEPVLILEDALGRVVDIPDGKHRVAAAHYNGWETIPAFVGRPRF